MERNNSNLQNIHRTSHLLTVPDHIHKIVFGDDLHALFLRSLVLCSLCNAPSIVHFKTSNQVIRFPANRCSLNSTANSDIEAHTRRGQIWDRLFPGKWGTCSIRWLQIPFLPSSLVFPLESLSFRALGAPDSHLTNPAWVCEWYVSYRLQQRML